jgi:alpha-tubulin suppressor-like RCC1 family protein
MKDPGPSVPLPLKPTTAGTKRKRIELQHPSTPKLSPNFNGPDSPMSSASVDSKRSTASHRKNEEVINSFPLRVSDRAAVFVFGAGSMGELGLGATQRDREVKRPRLNPLLDVDATGVVDVAVGGMHVAALDYMGRVWTWGVNDQGSLGRDTKSVSVDVTMKDDDDFDEEELNPLESKPGLVTGFPEGVQVVKLACGDSISVAIASDGKVYSWGTFRASDGLLGYSKSSMMSPRPTQIPSLTPFSIVQIACGTDHVLALSTTGKVTTWGNGQQFQMGRRVIERSRANGLIPRPLAARHLHGDLTNLDNVVLEEARTAPVLPRQRSSRDLEDMMSSGLVGENIIPLHSPERANFSRGGDWISINSGSHSRRYHQQPSLTRNLGICLSQP